MNPMNYRQLTQLKCSLAHFPRRFATQPSAVAGDDEVAGSGTGIGQITGWARTNGVHFVNKPSTEVVTNLPPMTESMPNLPEVEYASPLAHRSSTKVTKLSNGLRVASETRFGQFCRIGLFIDSGPRYEANYPSGVAHFLEKLAFSSTKNFPHKEDMLMELERNGGICDCQSSRDTLIYAATVDSRAITSGIRLLADVALRPALRDEELDAAGRSVQFELESLSMRTEQESILVDMIHAAAYHDHTLGLPKLCPKENVSAIDRNVLLDYLKCYHTPERMVVAGVGVQHDELVENVEEFFVKQKPIWTEEENIISNGAAVAQYKGGLKTEECEIPIYAAAGLPELAHVVIGLGGCSHHDPDFMALCVLNIMMGGGGAFTVGGPGNGMYSRLYSNVLDRYHWLFSATSYNHSYNDSGLFYIHASAPPEHVREMVDVLMREIVNMDTKPSKEELMRSKIQLQSMLLMNLESRSVVFEDIGRQVLAMGHRKRPEYYIREIDKVTAADVQRVAKRLLATKVSMAARGSLENLPALNEVQNALLPSGFSFFGRRYFLFN